MSSQTDEIRLEEILGVFWSGRWILIAAIIVGGILGIGLDKVIPKMYTTNARWLVSAKATTSGMSGLAALAGMMTGGVASSDNPAEQFYADLIFAPTFLDSISVRKFPMLAGDSASLAAMLRIDTVEWQQNPPPFDRLTGLRRAIVGRLIEDVITFTPNPNTFQLTIELPDPLASAALNNMILVRLMEYNRVMKEGDAQKEFSFVQEQLRNYTSELELAERRLQSFWESNMGASSPSLKTAESRLLREVTLQSTLVLEFRKRLEMARVGLARQPSEFEIVERPQPSLRPSTPGRLVFIILGIVGMTVLASVVLFVWTWVRKHGASFFSQVRKGV